MGFMGVNLIWEIGIVVIILIYALYKNPFTNNLIKKIPDYFEEVLRKYYRKQILKKSTNHPLLILEFNKILKLGFRIIFYTILVLTPFGLQNLSNLKVTPNNLKLFLVIVILIIMELVVYEQLDKNMEFKIKRLENKINLSYGKNFNKIRKNE